ncbi:MAG TPA: mevalonate kinase, partial [Chloroflexota bacterium]|nr:mevalonate kinase [Chloroflexota bacterium]
ARAPGKVILLGEHAINRGQPALAASVGLYATCTLRQTDAPGIVFRSDATGHAEQHAQRHELLHLAHDVDRWRAAEDYESIRALAGRDFFAPQKYVLAAALRDSLPEGLEISFSSELPRSRGLGSGGAAFAALATALGALTGRSHDRERLADWAHRGDVLSHGGVASRLDSQAALCGGVIQFTSERNLGEPVEAHAGLEIVIGNTGVVAATSEVNSKVRRWLAENPTVRMRYFESIGLLSRAALPALRDGDWGVLGRLLTLNQLVLEKIGVSTPELEGLIDAALRAGAHGAKLAGSGGGGIMFALVDSTTRDAAGQAIRAAGGIPLTPSLAVPGAAILESR